MVQHHNKEIFSFHFQFHFNDIKVENMSKINCMQKIAHRIYHVNIAHAQSARRTIRTDGRESINGGARAPIITQYGSTVYIGMAMGGSAL